MRLPRNQALDGLCSLLDQQLSKCSNAVAFGCDGGQVSYRDLRDRVSAMRGRMDAMGVMPGQVVGVRVIDPLERLVAVVALGKHRTHIVLVPTSLSLDTAIRLAGDLQLSYFISDSEIERMPTQYTHHAPGQQIQAGISLLRWNGEKVEIAVEEIHECCVRADALAENAERTLLRCEDTHDGVLLKILFASICCGGILLLDRSEHFDVEDFLAKAHVNGATVLYLQANMLQSILVCDESPRHAAWTSVRRIICEGWHLASSTIDKARTQTGADVHVTYPLYDLGYDTYSIQFRANDDAKEPRARIQAGNFIVVLDKHGRQAPPGTEGELHIVAGSSVMNALHAGLKRGKSIAQVVAESDGLQLISTGLLGTQLRGGMLRLSEFCRGAALIAGRLIRLDEIEAEILRLESVNECLVTARYAQEYLMTVAYLTVSNPASLTERDVLDFVRRRLPGFMVPKHYAFISRFPVNQFGTVDAEALRGIPVFDDALLATIRRELSKDACRVEVACVAEPPATVDENLLHLDDLGAWAATAAELVSPDR